MITELLPKVTGRKTRKLNEDNLNWLTSYFDTGNASEASRRLGITKSVNEHGAMKRRQLSDFIEANLHEMIGKCVPSALETIYELATKCPDPKIRLTAAQDLLNRAGYKEVTKIELSIGDKTDGELDNEIARLLNAGGIVEAERVEC